MKKEHFKLIFRWLLPFAGAVVVIMIMILNFSNSIRTNAVDTVEGNLERVMLRCAAEVKSDLRNILAVGKTAARVIEQQAAEKETVQKLLENVMENTRLSYAVYYDENQNAISHMGSMTEHPENSYEGVTEEALYFEEDSIIGCPAILAVVPVSERGDRLVLYYSRDRLREIVNIGDEVGKSSFTTVIDKQGSFLEIGNVKSNFLKGDNIWKNVDKGYQKEVTKVKVKMQSMEAGCILLAAAGEERTLVYIPLHEGDLILIGGISQQYVDRKENELFSRDMGRIYKVLAVMLLFLVCFVVISYKSSKKDVEKSRNLMEKADTDLLTGLNNKVATERKIREYISSNPDSLAMMFVLDIDNFKKINDTMGHAFGDEVLRSLGKQIGANFRVSDILGRTGGDEFTIFLKELKDKESILREAKKLDNFFKNFQAGEYVKYSATASIGAAVFPKDGNTFEVLYKAADQALYKAKKRGKNQYAFYDDNDEQKQTVQSDQ